MLSIYYSFSSTRSRYLQEAGPISGCLGPTSPSSVVSIWSPLCNVAANLLTSQTSFVLPIPNQIITSRSKIAEKEDPANPTDKMVRFFKLKRAVQSVTDQLNASTDTKLQIMHNYQLLLCVCIYI